jgi:hypothetical protein
MVRDMSVGRVDPYRLAHDLRQRPSAAQQVIIDPACTHLIASEEALF